MVTLSEQRLLLRLSRASGSPFSLSASVGKQGFLGCSAFFDKNGRFVAVGLNHLGLTPGPLRIVVADLSTGQAAGDFTVSDMRLGPSLKLVGFLQDKPLLVVLGTATPDHPTRVFSTALLRVSGEQESPPQSRTLPADAEGVGNVNFVDATHNRLWFKSSPQFCPLRSVPLVGDGSDTARVDEPNAQAACDAQAAIAYPNSQSLITATTREPEDVITKVDFAAHDAQQIALPGTGGRGSYSSVGRGALSADGLFFAVSRNLLSNSLVGEAHSRSTEVDIVQVSPLKLIGKVLLKPSTDPASLSIDHRDGTVTVLSFQGLRWDSQLVKDQ